MTVTAPGPLRAAIRAATLRLEAAGVPSGRYDAEELAAHVLGTDRAGLVRYEEIDVGAYDALVDQRARRRPLQHLTGVAHFRRLQLAVGPGVFVPRPETEVMVGHIIGELGDSPSGARVVDLGTGSGAIALALATEVAGLDVHAVEVDEDAHAWAVRNLAGSDVRLHLADAADALPELAGTVDVVVSNPPYIPSQAWETVAVEARDHDPGCALWGGGEDGLDTMRAIEGNAARLLCRGGLVAVEHADLQGDLVRELFGGSGRWRRVRGHRDLTERDRFVTARRI